MTPLRRTISPRLPLLAALALAACGGPPAPPALTAEDPVDTEAEEPSEGAEEDEGEAQEDPPDGDEPGGEEETPEEEPGEAGPSEYQLCFADITDESDPTAGPDYDQFGIAVGGHCQGTDHQDITGVERVVFLGDSITVGTPPSADSELYRNILADELASEFDLEAPDWWWQGVNVFEGTGLSQESGDFAICAKWGARADDLMEDNDQVLDCLPEDERDETTLVVMTVGGNDLASLTKGFIEGKSHEELWAQTEAFTGLVRETLEWLTEPGRFENGVYVVFTNLYEFTDGTGDVTACPVAELAGYGEAVTDPALEEMVLWSTEQYAAMSVDTGTDMLFLLENFCGHGFNYDDPDGRCYRGADAELWFDLTCTHPNPTGHAVIADMFMSVVAE